jgi:hypothetical protein
VQLALLIGAVRGAARAKAMREQPQQYMPYATAPPAYGQPPMNSYAAGTFPRRRGWRRCPAIPGYQPPPAGSPQQQQPRGPDALGIETVRPTPPTGICSRTIGMDPNASRRNSDPCPDALATPAALAIRSARLLESCPAPSGLVLTVVFGYFNQMQLYRPHFIALGLIVWFIPGVLFFTCAAMMSQGRRRGAVGGIFIAAVQEVFALGFLVGACILPPVSPIPILLTALWARRWRS